jgi:hypothetical protein
VSHVLYLVDVGEHFLDVNFEFNILKGKVVDITFSLRSLLFLHNVFSLIPQGKFMRTFNFSGRRVLISSSA